ncbi:antirestriction protein ArdA [Nostoc sp. FACHB-87]|uniref:antirestriction protein ArdA n=1 Tax=Nostocaceae TaxID=1162 RepID=UPI001687BB25|nr:MULTISPECIES: antirestriction protein ArdA [Nostocaceae]MBD2458399.1 antirestriction protein ArdA [Nostoc sp. FACHB-87]MBD2479505.1 antirestriction protein ArdA [Anabaena sp. FACHB-83]
MQLIFQSETEALAIAEQLYNVQQVGKILIPADKTIDYQALELAVNLAGVTFPTFNFPIVSSLKCRLPYPRDERECTDEDIPKIYVACLSAYNSGHLHGLWIDATQEPEDIEDDIKWMLSWSPVADDEACEEWAIHDYENWQGIQLNECEDIEHISELANLLEEHGQAYAVYYQYYGSDASLEDFQERYLGQFEDEEDFVYQMWEECGTLKKLEELGINSCYIDWKAIARDWFICDFYSVEVGYKEIYVFSRH